MFSGFTTYKSTSGLSAAFCNTTYNFSVKMGELDETYGTYYVILDDVEGLGYNRHPEGYADEYVFDPYITFGEDAADAFYLGDWSYYYPDYDELYFNYYSYAMEDYGYFVVAFSEPFASNGKNDVEGLNTVLAADSNKVYDLAGRRVAAPAKGQLTIKNGVKVIR